MRILQPLFLPLLLAMMPLAAEAEKIIEVSPPEGDATLVLQAAIDRAAAMKGRPVTIRLAAGDYHISRSCAAKCEYYISNTASAEENPDPSKHIGLWFKGLENVTLDGGREARLVTHGEMTSIVVDSCRNVLLKNFTLTAADPSVPEFKVLHTTDSSMMVEITAPSLFEIDDDGDFCFKGEGWEFGHAAAGKGLKEIAQVFYPETNVTLRCVSPLLGRKRAQKLGGRVVEFVYDKLPDVSVGEIYQFRHSIRNEVCAFVNRSSNVAVENVEFNFLGNFGLVGQYSENITYDNIRCRPQPGTARTNAGFADFVQMSGCKGRVRIANSYFEGAHDDPINIHGTHLRAVDYDGSRRLTVKFMHGQTYGFRPFDVGDSVEVVDCHTLLAVAAAKVQAVRPLDLYRFELELDRALPRACDVGDLAVENITWTPTVEIVNNYFARTPTRGILITTRGKSLIADNTFFRIPMSAILVSDDARSWYESGPVYNLTIRNNRFIECGFPVISVLPETDRFEGAVHRNITISKNRFVMEKEGTVVRLRAADNISVTDNIFELPDETGTDACQMVESENCASVKIEGNKICHSELKKQGN